MRFFWSGVTRPKTVCCSSSAPHSASSSGRRRASNPSSTSRPTSRAIAATVRGLSPEMTRTPTPCARKNASASAASGRTASTKVSTAAAARSAGSRSVETSSSVSADGACASTRVRRPDDARRVTAAPNGVDASLASSPNTISGAPSTHVPRGPSENETALHLRADENAMRRAASIGRSTGNGSRRHRAVALASGAAPYHPRASCQPLCSSSVSAASKRISPAVSVPVLSRQITSTRARPSTAGSSLTSTCCPAKRAAPTANAIEVISTSPSGIIAVRAAIVLTTACDHVPCCQASAQPPATIICAFSTSSPIGPIPHPTHFRTRSIDVRSSLETSWNRFASAAKVLA